MYLLFIFMVHETTGARLGFEVRNRWLQRYVVVGCVGGCMVG